MIEFLLDTLRLFGQLIVIGVVSFVVINVAIWVVDKLNSDTDFIDSDQ